MGLEIKSLPELLELRTHLQSSIALDPEHTAMERTELKEVEEWIRLRHKQDQEAVA